METDFPAMQENEEFILQQHRAKGEGFPLPPEIIAILERVRTLLPQ